MSHVEVKIWVEFYLLLIGIFCIELKFLTCDARLFFSFNAIIVKIKKIQVISVQLRVIDWEREKIKNMSG